MNYLKSLVPTAMAIAAMAMLIPGSASATTLEIGGVAQNGAVVLEASLAAGTSMLVKDTTNNFVDTCTGSTFKGTTEAPFTAATVTSALNAMTFTGCSHKTIVGKAGKLHIAWTAGTNGTVTSSGAEITVETTLLGISATCKTGAGVTLGTLTGVAAGHATLDVNAVLNCGIAGTKVLTATYTITSPTGLGIV